MRTDLLQRTDLASIPSIFGWFMRRHGRHTAAALLHDQMARQARHADDPWRARVAADLVFREALAACGVPPVRRWLMWAAVTLDARRKAGWARLGLIAWLLAALAGSGLLVYALVELSPLLIAVALLPTPTAWLWGRQVRAGLIAGYAFWVIVLGSVPSRAAYAIYQLAEWAARPTAAVFRRPAPPPPPSFDER